MKAPSLAQARFLKRIGQPLPMTWEEAANQITEYLKMNAATNIASPEFNLEEALERAAALDASNPSPATFTPGPWRISGDQVQSEKINAYGNFIICEIRREMTGEDCANARLIAAAPELLATLQQLVFAVTEDSPTPLPEDSAALIWARAAIASATIL